VFGNQPSVNSYGRSGVSAWRGTASDCLEEFDTLNLDETTARLFLYGNAVRVFKLEGM
jgi:hypothetical protein